MPRFDRMSQDIRSATARPLDVLMFVALLAVAPTVAQAGERDLMDLTGHWVGFFGISVFVIAVGYAASIATHFWINAGLF